jgi:hypothetical protein
MYMESELECKGTNSASAAVSHSPATLQNEDLLGSGRYGTSELIIGLVGAVGTDLKQAAEIVTSRLRVIGYDVVPVHITEQVIPKFVRVPPTWPNEYQRYQGLMNAGNEARKDSGRSDILALGVGAVISATRDKEGDQAKPTARRAYIVRSLKHPDEVLRMRLMYSGGFYLLGAYSDVARRESNLVNEGRMSLDPKQAFIKGLVLSRAVCGAGA